MSILATKHLGNGGNCFLWMWQASNTNAAVTPPAPVATATPDAKGEASPEATQAQEPWRDYSTLILNGKNITIVNERSDVRCSATVFHTGNDKKNRKFLSGFGLKLVQLSSSGTWYLVVGRLSTTFLPSKLGIVNCTVQYCRPPHLFALPIYRYWPSCVSGPCIGSLHW